MLCLIQTFIICTPEYYGREWYIIDRGGALTNRHRTKAQTGTGIHGFGHLRRIKYTLPTNLVHEFEHRSILDAYGTTRVTAVPIVLRYSSCRYNERELIDVTVVRRVRTRAERWCDSEGHRRWKRAGRTLWLQSIWSCICCWMGVD